MIIFAFLIGLQADPLEDAVQNWRDCAVTAASYVARMDEVTTEAVRLSLDSCPTEKLRLMDLTDRESLRLFERVVSAVVQQVVVAERACRPDEIACRAALRPEDGKGR